MFFSHLAKYLPEYFLGGFFLQLYEDQIAFLDRAAGKEALTFFVVVILAKNVVAVADGTDFPKDMRAVKVRDDSIIILAPQANNDVEIGHDLIVELLLHLPNDVRQEA